MKTTTIEALRTLALASSAVILACSGEPSGPQFAEPVELEPGEVLVPPPMSLTMMSAPGPQEGDHLAQFSRCSEACSGKPCTTACTHDDGSATTCGNSAFRDQCTMGGGGGSSGGGGAGGSSGGGGLFNLAYRKPSGQSSTILDAGPWRANDGNIDGNFYDGSVNHTNIENGATWESDLSWARVKFFRIYNRTDCCKDRFGKFALWLRSSTNDPWTHVGTYRMDNREVMDIQDPAYASRGYSLQMAVNLQGTNYLHLAEVEVWGHQ
jgi:hypothetical protein